MRDILVIDNLEQLKCVSDPFRIQLLEMLAGSEKTGQQLADELDIPRAKIHYHLRALEKNGIIEMVKTEQKQSIIQKYYAPAAKYLSIKTDLLGYYSTDKKDKDVFELTLDEAELPAFKKEMKKFVKKSSSKNGEATYQVSILPS